MRQIVEYQSDEGGSVLFEINIQDEGGIERVSRSRSGDTVKATLTFDEAIEQIQPAISKVIQKIRNLEDCPDEISLAFGIKLGSKVGAYIASANVEANFAVTLNWKNKPT